MKFNVGINAVQAGQKSSTVNAEPRLIANSTSGKFQVTSAVSKALGISVGENIEFFNNIDGLERLANNPTQDVVNLNDVWHDASEEEPNLIDSILIQFAEGYCDVYTIQIKAQTDLWHDWCKEYEVLRWAYVKDLLPKGGNV